MFKSVYFDYATLNFTQNLHIDIDETIIRSSY